MSTFFFNIRFFGLSSFIVLMSPIILNGIDVSGRFDSSFPRSVIRPDTVLVINDLNAVNIMTFPFPEQMEVSCVLPLSVCDEMTDECVLGVDYFACVAYDFCECVLFYRYFLLISSFCSSVG